MKIDIDKRKQQENIQGLSKQKIKKIEDRQEEFPIYDYLKEHPSIFISIISGFVVVIGFLFNCMIYASECKYLEYWNINQGLVNINNEHQIYELVMMSSMFLGLIFVQLFILNCVDRYYKDQEAFLKARIFYAKIKRKYKKTKKQIEKNKKDFKRNNKSDLLKQEIQKEKEYVEDLETYLKQYRGHIKNIKRTLRERRLPYDIVTILFTLLGVFISVYIFFAMFSIDTKFSHILIFAIALFCMLWIVAYLEPLLIYTLKIYIQFVKLDEKEQYEQHIKSLENLVNIEKYPIQKLLEFDLRVFLTKDMLTKVVFYLFLLLAVFVGTISSSKTNLIEENREFDIIVYENTDYAIMYRDDKYFYLEEVKIQEDDIYIYVNNQVRVSSEELYSVNRKFDNVIKVLDEEVK